MSSSFMSMKETKFSTDHLLKEPEAEQNPGAEEFFSKTVFSSENADLSKQYPFCRNVPVPMKSSLGRFLKFKIDFWSKPKSQTQPRIPNSPDSCSGMAVSVFSTIFFF